MRVWLYSRLSRDDDEEQNSLINQQKIIREYAEKHDFEIIGESFDDNVSGMSLSRKGIFEITDAIEAKLIDAIIVKDLSRLGRHETETASYIEYTRKKEIHIFSVTENIDTLDENNRLIISVKGIFNDMYVRDIARKVSAGMLQKQKEGLVITPPMGYFKDKNTGEVVIVEEHAQIVRRIFELYLEGYGVKNIAKMFNDEGIKSAGYYQKKLYGKRLGYNKPEIGHKYLWDNTGVKRILQNEFYAGTLICHKTYTSRINHVRKDIPEEEQYRHENAVPAIVSREIWDQAQFLLNSKQKRNVRASTSKPFHRYAGLIKCGDCGSNFVCRTRRWRNKPPRYEYTCNGYHRYGKENCTAHTIGEKALDEIIYNELLNMRRLAYENYQKADKQLQKWQKSKPTTEKQIINLQEQLKQRKSDQEEILLERIRDRAHADVYTKMLEDCEKDIENLSQKIIAFQDIAKTVKKRKNDLQSSLELMNRIIEEGAISNTHLRMLIDQIIIYDEGGTLRIKIILNGNFTNHSDVYDAEGDLVDSICEPNKSAKFIDLTYAQVLEFSYSPKKLTKE